MEAENALSTRSASGPFWRAVRWLVLLQALIAGLAILLMILATCASVLKSIWSKPINGVDDIVTLASAVAISCSLPYTTAVKGHVAIEYFFHRLRRRGRVVVDTIIRVLGMGLFGLLAWRCFLHGLKFHTVGQMAMTREIPLFWVPMVLSVSCGLVVLVILFNLLHPGRELIKP